VLDSLQAITMATMAIIMAKTNREYKIIVSKIKSSVGKIMALDSSPICLGYCGCQGASPHLIS
jgi:hypothetical protein